ncbi:MAG: hypothetical protein JST21_18860 [Bacteroidetes bacterium]|nr:hypothetical protein [Bacteroidota bacterium]
MDLLNIISVYSILLPFIIGVFFLKKLSKDSIVIWGITAAGIIPQMLRPVLDKTAYLHIAYNSYAAIEFLLMTILLSNKFMAANTRILFRGSVYAYIIIAMALIIVNGIRGRFLNELICLSSLLYAAWILMLIVEQFDDSTARIEISFSSSFTWFLLGMFFYALGTIMIFAFWNFVKNGPPKISKWLSGVHSIFNIILYLFICVGLVIDFLGNSQKRTKLKA